MICHKHGQQSTFCRFCDAEFIADHEKLERIRDAAPDLLEALQAAIECGMVPVTSASEGGAAKHSKQVAVADQIRAAIAKATGEPS